MGDLVFGDCAPDFTVHYLSGKTGYTNPWYGYPAAPAKPTGLKGVSSGYNSNKLTWDTVAGATGYSIYRSTSPDSGFTYLKGVTGTSYTNTGLTTGKTYYYQIKAYVMVGSRKVMSPVSATISAKPIPAKPTGLKVVSAGYDRNKITWNTVTGATGYSIYRSTSPDSGFTYLKGVTTNSYTNTGLTTGTTYYYQIKAYTLVGTTKVYSATSTTVNAKPVPAKPTGLKATVASTTSIKVSWNTVAGATGYSIYRSTSPDSGFTYLKGVTTNSYTNTGLTTGKTYYYKVRAYTMVGTTKVYSNTTSAVGAKP
jgi:fibronectin type 3 domain-containing protein